jgi:flagellar basal-body rod protein FlgB
MDSIYLFSLTSQRNQWLSLRQTTIAGNVANANTPGFEARDVAPFDAVLDKTQLQLARTAPGHLSASPAGAVIGEARKEEPWEVLHSGNTVSLEQEMLKAGDVNRDFSLNTSIIKAFHRMMLTSSKG